MNTDPADWLRLAIHRWLGNDGELTALGLTAVDRANARRWIRNKHIRAAWQLIPGDRFATRLAALVAACERIDRVARGYKHQRVVAPIFIELEMAAYWGTLPDERQLRTIVSETGDGFYFQEVSNNVVLKLFNEDYENDALSTRSYQDPR